MIFKRIIPAPHLQPVAECYWIVEDDNNTPHQQKIIPDGYPEIIFHYGDPFRIKTGASWEMQSSNLLAGQIRNFFYLENTGMSGVLGIKLKPTALTHLFNLRMDVYTDKVVPLESVLGKIFQPIIDAVETIRDHETILHLVNEQLGLLCSKVNLTETPVDKAVASILHRKGMITVAEMASEAGVGERHLERLFKKYVGLSPKFYARIIRFNYIFQLIQQEDPAWTSITFDSGFYDQSHFIRNFKAFTGEDPSAYFFEAQNMANFFLKKGK